MGSTSSLVEESDHNVAQAQSLSRYASRGTKLPHQDTCESDGGLAEDIGASKIWLLTSYEICSL